MQERSASKAPASKWMIRYRRMPLLHIPLFFILCVLLGNLTASAEERSQREYWIPGHGTLVLQVPQSWREQTRQPPRELPPTITLRPGEGTEFAVTIAVSWTTGSDQPFKNDEKLRALIESDRSGMLPNAVEAELPIRPIKGIFAHGYYYSATDKSPKPGDPAHVLRAEVATRNLLLSITMLSRQADSEAVQDLISMLQEAEQQQY